MNSNEIKQISTFVLIECIIVIVLACIAVASLNGEYFCLYAEAFCTIHMSIFVLSPLSKLLNQKVESKELFLRLFLGRIIILLAGDIANPSGIVVIDFISIFIGAFLVVPILTSLKRKKTFSSSPIQQRITFPTQAGTSPTSVISSQVIMNRAVKCSKCGEESSVGTKFCPNCGNEMPKEQPKTSTKEDQSNAKPVMQSVKDGTPFDKAQYDSYLFGSIDYSLSQIIAEKLQNNPTTVKATIPSIEKKKNIITFIFAVATVILLVIYFSYHINWVLIFSIIGIIIYFFIMKSYDIKKYLKKEVTSRPSEKIDYIISSTLSGKLVDNRKNTIIRIGVIILTSIIVLGVFNEPHLIYEKTDGGYAVRYYTLGIFHKDKELSIPKEYKKEPVVSIRGSVFSNVKSIKKVTLPETITEIRGEAFINCSNLESINLPKGIKEVKGSTFENCTNLKSIDIPEGVTRIGGSAFRECKSLSSANIPKTVTEIGSSAFRETALNRVCISQNASVNERAFKGTMVSIRYYENNCQSSSINNYGTTKFYDNDYTYQNEYGNEYNYGR